MSVVKFNLHASYVMIPDRKSLKEYFGVRTLAFLNIVYFPLLLLDFSNQSRHSIDTRNHVLIY